MSVRAATLAVASLRQGAVGWWTPDDRSPPVAVDDAAPVSAIHAVGRPVHVVDCDGRAGIAHGGVAALGAEAERNRGGFPLLAYAPRLLPEQLGDSGFRDDHELRFAYVGGAMANGISSVEMVQAFARAGMVGFFGSAGLTTEQIAAALERVQRSIASLPYGFNLIHTPSEPESEAAAVDLYLRRGVRLVSASAYLDLTPPLIRFRVAGIHRNPEVGVVAPNRVIAKVSRVEVARKFFSPPPAEMLQALVREGFITPDQARLAGEIPVAQDLTAEADSGGHTDNRPAITLLPTILALADELQARYGYARRLRVGAAGGIATPDSTAAAFAMGAAYVLTGTINQSCLEAGTSEEVRGMLAQAGQADVTMAPSADMFEMGVKVQVLKWGTMFAVRARKLYDLYRTYGSLEEIPAATRANLERDYFRGTLAVAWSKTREFFALRDPEQLTRADGDPKHRMALLFRSYLGQSSDWANTGEASRKADYQIWCGPAMGAFNAWVRGTFLESPDRRDVVSVAMNLLVGAAAVTRGGWLRVQGVSLSPAATRFRPQERGALSALTAQD